MHEERDERVIKRVATRALSRFLRALFLQLFLSLSPPLTFLSSFSSSIFRAEMVARDLRAGSSTTGDRVACVARGIHTRGASRVTRVAEEGREIVGGPASGARDGSN